MSGNLAARLPGSRPNGSSRNGMPDFAGYKFRKTEGWDPYRGVHLNEAEVMTVEATAAAAGDQMAKARLALAARRRAERRGRVAECARLLESGLTVAEAAAELGVTLSTVYDYQREARRRSEAP